VYLKQHNTLLSILLKGLTGLKVFALIVMLNLVSGCAVSMMSPYDEETNNRIGMLTDSTNHLLFHLEDLDAKKPDCEYENHAEQYRDIKVQLKSFQMYELAKPKNVQTLKQVEALQERISQLVTMHKKQCLPAAAVRVTQHQINSMLGHMIKLESSKRRSE
jgi:hypothetical protein